MAGNSSRLGRLGFVLVKARNNGPLNATAQVNATFDGSPLTATSGQTATLFMINGSITTFNFTFKPSIVGSNKTLIVNVSVVA